LDDQFLEPDLAEAYYHELRQTIPWETSAKINRWVYLCQDRGLGGPSSTYQYRDAPTAKPLTEEEEEEDNTPDFTELVRSIALRAQQWYQRHMRAAEPKQTDDDDEIYPEHDDTPPVHFNVCLLNYYENGLQRIGWHADREEMGRTTPVLSVSLGATRSFYLRAKVDGGHDRAALALTAGSILGMAPPCQERYVHAIPKEPLVTEGRINLTFRCKQNDTMGEQIHERRNHWLPAMLAEELPEDGAENSAIVSNGACFYTNARSAPSGWSLWSTSPSLQHPNDMSSNDAVAMWQSTKVFGDDVSSGHDVSSIQYMVKTNLGAECYCAAEIQECLAPEDGCIMARPCGMDGYVAVCAPGGTTEALDATKAVAKLLRLRSAHHVMQYHTHFDLSDCCRSDIANQNDNGRPARVDGEAIYQYCKDCLAAGTMSISTMASFSADQTGSFRVTCERIGTSHSFRGPEIERYAWFLWIVVMERTRCLLLLFSLQ
jgi:alkylated DNA repair dioxygenase AlkB